MKNLKNYACSSTFFSSFAGAETGASETISNSYSCSTSL